MAKRDTYLPSKDTRPPLGSPEIEAAKFLRDMALDFIKDRSAAHVVDEAVRNWLAVRRVPACPRCRRQEKLAKMEAGVYRRSMERCERLERERDEAHTALRAIIAHHENLNTVRGRPVEHSFTIRTAREGLAAAIVQAENKEKV